MVITCYCCPLQLAFAGKRIKRQIRAFGWIRRNGRFYCSWCA